MDLSHIWRTFHPRATKYTLPSSTHGEFFKTDHMCSVLVMFMCYVTKQVSRFKRTEIISSITSKHSGMKLETNYMRKT